MPSCANCADKIIETRNGYKSVTGFPCIHGHKHEPWPDIMYAEAPSEIEGVSRMVRVPIKPSNN